MGKGTGRLTRSQFVEMLRDVWSQAMKKENIISGFKSCGIFPVDESKFPTTAFKKEQLDAYLETISKTAKDNTEDVGVTSSGSTSSLMMPQPQPLEKESTSCQHLPTETCISSCQNKNPVNSETTTEPELEISDINKMSEVNDIKKKILMRMQVLLWKSFFSSPQKKNDNVTIIVETPPKKIVIPRLKQLTYGEVLTTEQVLKRLKEAQEKKNFESSTQKKRGTEK